MQKNTDLLNAIYFPLSELTFQVQDDSIASVGAVSYTHLVNTSARSEELAVKGCIRGDRHMIYHAILFDPLTASVLSMDEIQDMVDEMFEANRDYLPQFT